MLKYQKYFFCRITQHIEYLEKLNLKEESKKKYFYYTLLNCTPKTKKEEIKKNYKKIIKKIHPDINKNNLIKKKTFKKLKKIYKI